MSHFYGSVQGSQGKVTRTGSKQSGYIAEAKGWDLGGKVRMEYNTDLNTDVLTLYLTRNNGKKTKKVASFAIINDKLSLLETEYPEALI